MCPTGNHLADIVIVAPLSDEKDAVLQKLPGYQILLSNKEFQADLPVIFPDKTTGTYRLIVVSPAKGRIEAGIVATQAIQKWHPRYVLIVGIAGGILRRNVRIGDILIAEQIVDYGQQKQTKEGPEIRPDVHKVDYGLLIACKNIIGNNWREDIRIERPGEGNPDIIFGDIASGDNVIASSKYLAKLLDVFPNLRGVEMEAGGIAPAARAAEDKPGFFMVRGVSDYADENKDSIDVKKWRPYVCDIAASFTIAFLKSGPITVSTEIYETQEDEENETSQNEYIETIRKLSLPFSIDFQVKTPSNLQQVRKEDIPLTASGTYTSEKKFHAWVILDDKEGKFYIQAPPIEFFPTKNCWKATNIRPEPGIEHIHFIYVDEQGNLKLRKMVRENSWGSFKKLPPNSRFLKTISINRV